MQEVQEVNTIENKIEVLEQKIVTIQTRYKELLKRLQDLEAEKVVISKEMNTINGSFLAFTETVNLLKAQE